MKPSLARQSKASAQWNGPLLAAQFVEATERQVLRQQRISLQHRRSWCLASLSQRLLLFPIALALVLTASAAVTASDPRASRPMPETRTNAPWVWREEKLGALPAEATVVGNPFVESHGWRYGVVVRTAEGVRLWLDGTYRPVHGSFAEASIADAGLVYEYAFSPEGEHLAYPVKQDRQMRMVLDDKPGPPAEDVSGPVFSPDGRHLAYRVQRKGNHHVLLDGVPGPASDGVPCQIRFSPDSRRIAYFARRGKEIYMVVDQQERRDWPGFGNAVFSPNSQSVAYANIRGYAVLNGQKGPEFPANTCWGPVFSSDSRHFAYTTGNTAGGVRHEQAWVDWRPLPLPNGGTGVWHVVFSPDLKRWACVVNAGNKQQVVLDGRPGPWYDSAWGLRFSPDGVRLAYMAKVDTNWFMVVDGKLGATIDLNPSSPCFSPDGKRLAYIAGRGPKWWMVVDGRPGPENESAERRQLMGFLSEMWVPALTQPQFSPDSRHVAYGARQGGQWVALLDNQPVGGSYEMIVEGGPSFHKDGSLEFLGMRQRVLYRVVAKP